MSDENVEPGDAVHRGDPVIVDRYTTGARINHWITAASLILLALVRHGAVPSEPVLPDRLFGGGQTTRIIHPWIGVVLFFSFLGLFLRFWKANLWKSRGRHLARAHARRAAGNEERLPEVGKYNAGQKFVFWAMSGLIIDLDLQRHRDLGSIFLRTDLDRAKAHRDADPCYRRGSRDHLVWIIHVLCSDLGAWHDPAR